MKKRIAALVLAGLVPAVAQAWTELGTYYQAATLQVQLGDICDSGRFLLTPGSCAGDAANPDWRVEIQSALDRWHSATSVFQFTTDGAAGAVTPGACAATDPNSSFFLDTVCGDAFGGSTLSVALTSFFPGLVNLHSDVIFNTAFTWGAYDDAGSNHPGVIDFRRVAVHEFGHVAGLAHPFHELAIMAPVIQDVINMPQPDDIAGMNGINGGSFSRPVDDLNANGSEEILLVRANSLGQVIAEIRDSQTGEVLYLDSFFEAGFHALDAVLLADEDANGFRDLAILALRTSDLQPLVRIRNIGGSENTRKVKFNRFVIPFGTGMISAIAPKFLRDLGDADGDGSTDLAVIGGSLLGAAGGYVEVRNSDGTQGERRLFGVNSAATPVGVKTLAALGQPARLAILMFDWATGAGYVELRNAFGAQQRTRIALHSQATPIDFDVYEDAGDSWIAYLSERQSNGQTQIELRSMTGQPGSGVIRLDTRFQPLGITAQSDQDGDGNVDFAAVVRRTTDNRTAMLVANTVLTNVRFTVMPDGYDAAGSYFNLGDSDGDGFGEVAAQLSRLADGLPAVHYANIAGPQTGAKGKVFFTP
jgi:hypothetical protein